MVVRSYATINRVNFAGPTQLTFVQETLVTLIEIRRQLYEWIQQTALGYNFVKLRGACTSAAPFLLSARSFVGGPCPCLLSPPYVPYAGSMTVSCVSFAILPLIALHKDEMMVSFRLRLYSHLA
jgi:hypothetical protein